MTLLILAAIPVALWGGIVFRSWSPLTTARFLYGVAVTPIVVTMSIAMSLLAVQVFLEFRPAHFD